MTEAISVLWVDDEVDMLKPHILFLSGKGYRVDTATGGAEALDWLAQNNPDVILLDENMPGLSGLETLRRIKALRSAVPVVMITKSEEEHIMEDAIGAQIADYLIKPVNPNQILLSLKKITDGKRLVSEKTTQEYQMEFRQLAMALMEVNDMEGWYDLYKRLVYWELELDQNVDPSLRDMLLHQKREANGLFFRFIEDHYPQWLKGSSDAPLLSPGVLRKKVFPLLGQGKPVVLVVIDNLRYDQWLVIKQSIAEDYRIVEEEMYTSILPTATQYARNALFAGLSPLEIKRRFPDRWVEEADEESKNNHEDFFLGDQLKRAGKGALNWSYHKVLQPAAGRKLAENYKALLKQDFTAIVFNFVDMLSHAKTETAVVRELIESDKAYRSLTLSWYQNSALGDLLRNLANEDVQVVLTTDHGTVNVDEPVKVVGDRNLTTNLRYKMGKGMNYDPDEVMAVRNPEDIQLPKNHISAQVIFAREHQFFAYPNNYNHYVRIYKNSYQHGGISMEECMIPVITLSPRNR
jgi:CheY-like chemotaxis protein